MKPCALFLVLLIVTVAVAAGAEEEPRLRPDDGMTFADRYELTIVNVVTYVTDKKGNPVMDLTKEEFRVFQDGQEREISNFHVVGGALDEPAAETPTETGQEPVEEAPPPEIAPQQRAVSMVLYIDNQNLRPLDRNRVLRDIRAFVLDNLRPPVRMMVVSFQADLKILQPFTSDSRLVLDALRSLGTHSGGRIQRDSVRQDILGRMWEESEQMGQVTGYSARKTRSYNEALGYADEESYNLSRSMDALREVVGFLVGLPGRKSVLYVSNGLPMVPGMDLFNIYADVIRDPTILTEVQRYDRSTSFQSLVDAANTQDVSFYTIGAGGLEVPGMASSFERSARGPVAPPRARDTGLDGLRYMATGTGGLSVVKTNDFAGGFEQIEADLLNYYSLGYRLIPSGRDKVHSIEVSIPNRPDLVVRCRSRFVEKSFETRVQERVLASLMNEIDENPMELGVEAGTPSLATDGSWSVPIHVSFPIGKVAVLPEGEEQVGRVVLYVAARDLDGRSSETVREDFEIRLPIDGFEQIVETRFNLGTRLIMQAGSYRVAVGLMDEVTRQASFQTVKISLSAR